MKRNVKRKILLATNVQPKVDRAMYHRPQRDEPDIELTFKY